MKKLPPSAADLLGPHKSAAHPILQVADAVMRLDAELCSRLGQDISVPSARQASMRRTRASASDNHQTRFLLAALDRAILAIFRRIGLADLIDTMVPATHRIDVPQEEAAAIGAAIGIPDLMDDPHEIAQFIDYNRADLAHGLLQLVRRTADAAMAELEAEIESQDCIDPDDLIDLVAFAPYAAPAADIRFFSSDKVSVSPISKAASQPHPTQAREAQVTAVLPDAKAIAQREQIERQNATIAQLQSRLDALQRSKEEDASAELQLADLNRGLRARVRVLELALERARSTGGAQSPSTLPTSWADLSRFADERLAGNVVISNKAVRAARASVFEDIEFAYAVLLMLAEDYVPMRRGDEGARARFEASCVRLRVDIGPTGEAADMHRTKAAYRVQHLGKTLTMDLHVRGSSARDPRDGFRLYFTFYCPTSDHDGYVVVGSFPTHLDNTRS